MAVYMRQFKATDTAVLAIPLAVLRQVDVSITLDGHSTYMRSVLPILITPDTPNQKSASMIPDTMSPTAHQWRLRVVFSRIPLRVTEVGGQHDSQWSANRPSLLFGDVADPGQLEHLPLKSFHHEQKPENDTADKRN